MLNGPINFMRLLLTHTSYQWLALERPAINAMESPVWRPACCPGTNPMMSQMQIAPTLSSRLLYLPMRWTL